MFSVNLTMGDRGDKGKADATKVRVCSKRDAGKGRGGGSQCKPEEGSWRGERQS